MKYLQAAGVAAAMLAVSFVSAARAQEGPVRPLKEGTGSGWMLSAIEIKGARCISSEELVGFMKYTKVGKPLHVEKLEIDLDRARLLLYADRGFLRAQFKEPQIVDTDLGAKVILSVDEGLRYRTGKVKIEDATVIPSERIRELIAIKTGDIASEPAINRGVQETRKAYDALGYIRFSCDLSPEWKDPLPGSDDGIADLTFSMQEDVPYTFRKVTLIGNTVTTDDALLKVFAIKGGALCSVAALDRGVQRLTKLDLFDEVSVSEERDDNTRQVDITVKLRPKRASQQ